MTDPTARLFTLLDVFAERPLEGNPLPVIHDADGVDTEVMALLARRLRVSETSFLQSATTDGADFRNRIFTVAGEIDFAGHPSLGAAAAHAWRLGLSSAEFVQETRDGLRLLSVTLADREGSVALEMAEPAYGSSVPAAAFADALGLSGASFHPSLPAQLVSVGLPAVIVPLRDAAPLDAVRVDIHALSASLTPFGDGATLNAYVVGPLGGERWQARCFAADLVGGEDPATGSAAGAFGAYLRQHRGDARAVIDQGLQMGMPSRIDVEIGDVLRIAGRVQLVGSGEIRLPGVGQD
jgi:trans-2,3-dihydro-3-hydroxyanthranilate isomerase